MVKIWKLAIFLPYSTSCKIKYCYLETLAPSNRIKSKNKIFKFKKGADTKMEQRLV